MKNSSLKVIADLIFIIDEILRSMKTKLLLFTATLLIIPLIPYAIAEYDDPVVVLETESGDIVIGTVEAVLGSMIIVLTKYINSKPVKSHVECICSTSNIRKRNIALVNDLVKIKIIGKLNGAIHGTINDPNLGVLFTKCRKCGNNVKPFRDIVKCVECGWTDDRKLSNDFLKSNFVTVRE